MRTTRYLYFVGGLVLAALATCSFAQERVDCWWEEPGLFFSVAANGQPISGQSAEVFKLDYADKAAGDCSVRYDGRKGAGATTVGFTPGAYQKSWGLSPTYALQFQLKAHMASPPATWPAILTDTEGRAARGVMEGIAADDKWHAGTLTLQTVKGDAGFDVTQIASCRLDVPLGEDATLWLDDVRWADPKSGVEIGVTDKTIDQRMAEAKSSLDQRRQKAFEEGSKRAASDADYHDTYDDAQLYDELFAGHNPQQANKDLRAFYSQELEKCQKKVANLWHLSMNVRLIFAYYHLGKGSANPAMEPATEKLLLQLLWERTKDKNDIAISKWSTWWMVGSENHDLNSKTSDLISSRIFAEEPDYASRVYPDTGHGDGYGYWFHGLSREGRDVGAEGRANLSDGKPHTAKEHYAAWAHYLKEYLAERAKKGFFLERGSSTYFKYTVSFIQIVHDYCGDKQLAEQARQFLDLVWADWAQEQIAGIRGGPKTRHYNVGGYDPQTELARFYTGGPLSTTFNYGSQLLSDYVWPRVVWELALNRESMGSYACESRGIGEEEATRPRPAGAERSMLGNVESRFVKYSWVTPDYILGTQMDHPDARYNHLAQNGRWEGMIVGDSPDARIAMFVNQPTKGSGASAKYAVGAVWSAVQDRRVLVTQQSRRWTGISPEWFPAPDDYSQPVAIYVGKAWDAIEEKGGWVFIRRADAYAAVRVIDSQKNGVNDIIHKNIEITNSADPNQLVVADKTYDWSEDHQALELHDKFSPVIVEAGSRRESGSFAAFEKAVLANPLKLYKTAVPGFFIVSYRGAGSEGKEIIYNAASPGIPSVGGKYIDYSPVKVFDSPFIQSDYNSGRVLIHKGSEELALDFNNALAK